MKGMIFTYLLTAMGVGGSIFSPFYGFLAYVALALLKPDAMWAHSIQGGRFSLIVALSMLLSWGFRGFGNWNLGGARRITFLFVAFWLWCVFLALGADSPPHAWYYVESMAKILLPFLVGITTCRTITDLKALAWVIVVCEGYVCFELNMHYFGGFNYLWHLGFGGVDNNSAAIGFVTALGIAFFLFLNSKPIWQKAILAGCMAFILHAIQFSFSRGAMLATCIGVMLSFFLIKKKVGHYALFGAAMVIGIYLAGPEVRDRFMRTFEKTHRGEHERSAQNRIELWGNCYDVLMRDPIFGCGPDHWPLHAESFGWPKMTEAHSLWVQTTAETGIPGILLYAGFYGTCILQCWILLRKQPEDVDPWIADSCRMTIASLCGFAVAAQFVSLEALEVPYYVCLLGAGSLMIHSRSTQPDATEATDPTNLDLDWRDSIEETRSGNFCDGEILIYN